jgi:putative membrane protein
VEILEEEIPLEKALQRYLSNAAIQRTLQYANPSTHLISELSKLTLLCFERGLIEDFRHMELQKQLTAMLDAQGKSERIKNFPYPRIFATTNRYFVWIFLILLPFGMLREFENLGDHWIWLTIPFSTLVSWVYHSMERIGESTENPFQGGANDVPITSISRKIEIDLLQMLDENDIPEPIEAVNNILT